MLFNSREFVAVVLPASLAIYYLFVQLRVPSAAKGWLLAVSLFMYFTWDPVSWPLLVFSIAANSYVGSVLSSETTVSRRRFWLGTGILSNIFVLGCFKYAGFIVESANGILGTSWASPQVSLPVGISFYTFAQLAYLADCYEGLTAKGSLLDYAVFVTFFPKMVSGPIARQKEVVPQLTASESLRFDGHRLTAGAFLFLIGLTKKLVVADNLAGWVNAGFSSPSPLGLIESWATSVSFTLQVYFDFSGYTDMALGLGLMFNIILPNNFNSPLRATSIINFWQRWHMTLTRFLTTYVFSAILRQFQSTSFPVFASAIMLTMLVSGLWHGGTWLFVAFGLLHGVGLVVNHYWRSRRLPMAAPVGWFLTFSLVSVSNVFFRAETWDTALSVVKGMVGLNGVGLPASVATIMPVLDRTGLIRSGAMLQFAGGPVVVCSALACLLTVCMKKQNSIQMLALLQRPAYVAIAYVVLMFYAIVLFGRLDTHTYVYFQF